MKSIKPQYGFPLFTRIKSSDYILKSERIRVSDIWALWHHVIKSEKKRFPGTTDYSFLVSVLEQAQYFYEAATLAPVKSQPLLYYYSFLNLAKAVIVLNNPSWLATNLEFNHGIDACQIKNTTQLADCSVCIKNLISQNGNRQKISVAYELSLFLGDTPRFLLPPIDKGHDNGPWKINVISLFQSCIGIHRTVCETYKKEESFTRINDIELKKEGRNLCFEGTIHSTPLTLTELSNANYFIKESNSISKIIENHSMINNNLSRMEFFLFSTKLLKKGLWTYTTSDEYRLYINPNRFMKSPEDGIYRLKKYDAKDTEIEPIVLSSASIIYFIMFFLGSITRYHPYLFEKILSDKEIWMVSEFLKTQPFQFLMLVTSRILGRPILSSKMPFQW